MPRKRIIARLVASVLMVSALFAFPTGASAASPCPDANVMPTRTNGAQVRAATLCLINLERTSRGIKSLKSNRHLLKAARRYSYLMVQQRFFGHVSPAGTTLTKRVRNGTRYLRGARRWALAENLAWGSGKLATPASTVKAWMTSSGHRKNMLMPGFRHIGIGIVTGAPVGTKGLEAATYTTDFGRRS